MELPKFFGIDIGKKNTRIVVIDRAGGKGKPKVTKVHSFPTGQGNLTTEDPTLQAELANRIKDAVNTIKLDTRKCVVALPEPAVFNRLLTFPELAEKELNQSVHWNAKQFIPIPIDEVQMDWIKTAEVNDNGKKMIQLLLVAAPKKLITRTLEIFKKAELEPIAIETESVATSRAIANSYGDKGSILILDIGSAGTDLSVVANGKLIFSQSLGTGSEAMTKSISTQFSLDEAQAEQYKLKFGLLQDQGDGKIFQVLQPVVNIICNEVTKTINFFRSKYQQSTPQSILILGEGGMLPGLPQYITKSLGIQADVANLTNNLELEKDVQGQNLVAYGVALGLALKTE